MKEDNNPFRPALSKPVDDSVLANDPHADNFLAGNDRLARQQRVTMDVMNGSADNAPHLDQMGSSTGATDQTAGASMSNDASHGDISNLLSSADLGGASSAPTAAPAPNIFEGLSDGKKDKKRGKKHLLGRKKKSADTKPAEAKPTPISPAAATESVFGSSLDFNKSKTGDSHSAPLVTDSTVAGHDHDMSLDGSSLDSIKHDAHDASTLSNEQHHDTLDILGSLSDTPKGDGASDNDSMSPIGASLAAAAAAADSQTGDVSITPTKDAGKVKAAKAGQPKQLTVSVLTIIFFILFAGATATAIYFGIQNNKNVNALGDAQAELQQLKDQNADSSNSANKESTQFDALQDRIKELTEQNDAKQKTIDENKTTIDNLNKQVSDLNQQVTAANNKLTSDTSVSDKMQSLITTMCASPDFAASSVCIDANGGNAGGAVQPDGQ